MQCAPRGLREFLLILWRAGDPESVRGSRLFPEKAFRWPATVLSSLISSPPQSSGRSAARIADSSSTNAVSFSSARTTKRFPSSRCASAIQIVRPLESIAETQPQLQPALLRLSAMMPTGERSGLPTHTGTTESVSLCTQMKADCVCGTRIGDLCGGTPRGLRRLRTRQNCRRPSKCLLRKKSSFFFWVAGSPENQEKFP